MPDESAQAMLIMMGAAGMAYQSVVLPSARAVVGTSLTVVSHLSHASADAVGRYLRDGEATMRALERKGDVKFVEFDSADLEAYRHELKKRGVDFKIEQLENRPDKVRLWYVGSDTEKIKAAIIDAGARFIEQDRAGAFDADRAARESETQVRINDKTVMDKELFDDWMKRASMAEDRQRSDYVLPREEMVESINKALESEDMCIEYEGERFDVGAAVEEGRIRESELIDIRGRDAAEQDPAWRAMPATDKQIYTVRQLKREGLIPPDAEYSNRGEASDLIGRAMDGERAADTPASDPRAGDPPRPAASATHDVRKDPVWRAKGVTSKQEYTIGKFSDEGALPPKVPYSNRGEASDLIGAALGEGAGKEATSEQMKVIGDMRAQGRIAADVPTPQTRIEAHQVIDSALRSEAARSGRPFGASWSSTREAVAWVQGEMAPKADAADVSRMHDRALETELFKGQGR